MGLTAATASLQIRLDQEDFLLGREASADGRIGDEARRQLFVVLERDSTDALPSPAETVRAVADRLAAVPGVAHVRFGPTPTERRLVERFVPEHSLLFVPGDSLEALGALLASDFDSLDVRRVAGMAQGFVGRWQPGSRLRTSEGLYASPDGRQFFIEVGTELGDGDFRRSADLLDDVEGALAELRRDLEAEGRGWRLDLVGYPATLRAIFHRLSGDAIRVGLAATMVVWILLWIVFRRGLAPLIVLAPVGVGMLATGAVAAALLPSVSLATLLFVPLLLGLGVDAGVHLASAYWRFAPGDTRLRALAAALERAGPGIGIAAVTSAAALAAAGWIPSVVAREVAILSAIGLLAIVVCTLVLLPIVLSLTRPGSGGVSTDGIRALVPGASPGAGRLAASVVFLAVVLGGLLSLRELDVALDRWRAIVATEPTYLRLAEIVDVMGVAPPPLSVRSSGADVDEALARDRKAVESLLDLGLTADIAAVQSLTRWLPSPERQQENLAYVEAHPELFAPARLERLASRLNSLSSAASGPWPRPLGAGELTAVGLDDLRGPGPGSPVERHLTYDADGVTATSFVFLRRFPWRPATARRFSRRAHEVGLFDFAGTTVPDPAMSSRRHEGRLRRSAAAATVTAVAAVLLILGVRFRRVGPVLLCLAPLSAGLASALICFRLLGVDLSMTTIAILPILAGISVDDGVHVVDGLWRGEGLAAVRARVGRAMLATTLTTTGGLACLALASWEDVRVLGLVGSVGLWAAYATAVFAVPAWWAWFERREAAPREARATGREP